MRQNLSDFHLFFCRELGLLSNCPVCVVLGTMNMVHGDKTLKIISEALFIQSAK